jgi:hypothetical protein
VREGLLLEGRTSNLFEVNDKNTRRKLFGVHIGAMQSLHVKFNIHTYQSE